jgi:hypothetical protein
VGVLARLAAEARSQGDAHECRRPLLGDTAAFLSARAFRTATLLAQLSDEGAAAVASAALTASP